MAIMQITNKLQLNIMHFVDCWVKNEKTPVPRVKIIASMEAEGIKDFTVISAIGSLIRKKYIRRAGHQGNNTFYVQLRGI